MIRATEVQRVLTCSRDEAADILHVLRRTARIGDWADVAEKLRDIASDIEARVIGAGLAEYQEFRNQVLSAMRP